MNLWNLTLWAALLFSAASGIFYAMAASSSSGLNVSSLSGARQIKHAKELKAGRISMAGSLLSLLLASGGLLSLLIGHDFRFEYIVHNSSRSLESIYIVSAFWAGQEGSLLLWALFSAVFGCLLMLTAKDHEATAMPWYALVHSMLLLVAVRMSPFTMVAQPPADGFGLNPLLMNPWMAIHPPIVFAGYAAIAAPYALAMSALVKKEYQSWAKSGTWWNLLSWLLLGSGIMIGARWAYAVLGWGGYWGWDPVENASLVPWLFGAVLLHTFLSQKARGKMVRTNIALAIATYLLIGYGAFLTRSGVLSDFSVHSFSDLGISSYLMLFIFAIGLPALVLYIYRFKDMTASRKYTDVFDKLTTRDFGIFAGASVLLAAAVVTLLGTSAPILTGILGDSQAVDTSFYNITNFPLAVLIALLMGLFPLFKWGNDELKSARASILASLVLSIAGTAIMALAGARGVNYLLFMFASLFGLFANIIMFLKTVRHGVRHIGSYLTHIGVALVFAGIISTSGWSTSNRAMIPVGGSADAAGLTVEAGDLSVSEDGLTTSVSLNLYDEDRLIAKGIASMQETSMGSTMRHPMIHSSIMEDIYISPLVLEEGSSGMVASASTGFEVLKGQAVQAGALSISFSAFDLSAMNSGKVGAALTVEEGSSVLYDGILYYSVTGSGGSDSKASIKSSGGLSVLSIEGIDASSGLVLLSLAEAGEEAIDGSYSLLVEISRKPFVWLLWAGACLIAAGTAIAVVKRKSEA